MITTTRTRQGFSLIEALVALTIAAITLTAIFELQIQMVRGQERATEALSQVAAQENAIALMRDLNPMAHPFGQIALPEGDTIRWSSMALDEPVRGAGFPSGDGRYRLQRFRVTVEVQRPSGRSPRPLVFERVGWTSL